MALSGRALTGPGLHSDPVVPPPQSTRDAGLINTGTVRRLPVETGHLQAPLAESSAVCHTGARVCVYTCVKSAGTQVKDSRHANVLLLLPGKPLSCIIAARWSESGPLRLLLLVFLLLFFA
ncbi:hypothetical protein AAFF_G00347790 [Aldrovandia affinis]|uniref:Uncharacterized protein n=1 Tax=Aldrovandia affinis TaxID=143900 RepID=A0AAD7SM01_9TELE|nr:hypothetical protein AAFF_G00347790 [Aldrovandia affinis]